MRRLDAETAGTIFFYGEMVACADLVKSAAAESERFHGKQYLHGLGLQPDLEDFGVESLGADDRPFGAAVMELFKLATRAMSAVMRCDIDGIAAARQELHALCGKHGLSAAEVAAATATFSKYARRRWAAANLQRQ